jgi:hypothetical protein
MQCRLTILDARVQKRKRIWKRPGHAGDERSSQPGAVEIFKLYYAAGSESCKIGLSATSSSRDARMENHSNKTLESVTIGEFIKIKAQLATSVAY